MWNNKSRLTILAAAAKNRTGAVLLPQLEISTPAGTSTLRQKITAVPMATDCCNMAPYTTDPLLRSSHDV